MARAAPPIDDVVVEIARAISLSADDTAQVLRRAAQQANQSYGKFVRSMRRSVQGAGRTQKPINVAIAEVEPTNPLVQDALTNTLCDVAVHHLTWGELPSYEMVVDWAATSLAQQGLPASIAVLQSAWEMAQDADAAARQDRHYPFRLATSCATYDWYR